jgi:voltage-gated potassium channel Kch
LREHIEGRRFQILLGVLLVLLVLHPYASELGPAASVVLGAVPLTAALYAVSRRPPVVVLGAILLVLSATGSVVRLTDPHSALSIGGLVGELFFFLIAIGLVFPLVFQRARVSRDTLFGAAGQYLLICLAFAAAYRLVELVVPGSLSFTPPLEVGDAWSRAVYFSLVTLTTLGYGDVAPVSDAARSLACLEAVIGILYPTVLIARLVSLYTSGHEAVPFHPRHRAEHGRAGRLEFLFVALVATLLGHPYLPLWVTRLISAGVVLAALRVLPTRGLATGAVLAIPAFVAAIVAGEDTASGAYLLSQLLAGAMMLFVTLSIAREVFGGDQVDRDVLFGSGCVFLLMGFAWSHAYACIGILQPGSLSFPAEVPVSRLRADTLYLSFVTLTTLGYGDLTPVSRAAESLAGLESMLGVLYPAILVARLMSLYR